MRPRPRSCPSPSPTPALPKVTSTCSLATGCRRWRPTSRRYRDAGKVETVRTNLEGAKYTLATNEAGAALGIKDFKDIAAHKDALEGKIFGIEPGNDGNRLILDMIASGPFGLDGFEVVESSEQGMLAEVAKRSDGGRADRLPRLGTPPDERQLQDDLSDRRGRLFRPELRRGDVVATNTRAGYVAECPNQGKFLQNLSFTLAMENEIMGAILNDGDRPARCRKGLARRQSRRLGGLARRRDSQGRQRCQGRRVGCAAISVKTRPRGPTRGLSHSTGGTGMDWLTDYKIPVGKVAKTIFDLDEPTTSQAASSTLDL